MTTIVNVGDVLVGKYRVEKVLGIGGMGMVVAATHLELEQRVALKFMLPSAMASPQAVDRFLREARAAVRLRSEHVCKVLDVGKLENGAPYIVMEFMEGEDFGQLLERLRLLPVTEAVDYVLQALEGIAEAHANGIVHRDLKPGNLFVTTKNDGSPLVKVLDFGISKSSFGGGATKTGDVMGSPAYMAPEQMVSSKDVDARADLWAMGVILYQAASGKLPFDHESLPVLCMAVMNENPLRLEIISSVPSPFSKIVMRCLEKKRDDRFTDVGELALAIAPFGGPAASMTAMRIVKVLRRVSGAMATQASGPTPGVAATLMSTGDALLVLPQGSGTPEASPTKGARPARDPNATPVLGAHPRAAAVEPHASQGQDPAFMRPAGMQSTLGASAGQSVRLAVDSSRRKRHMVVAIVAAFGLSAAGVTIGVVTRHGAAKPAAAPHAVPAASSSEAPAVPPPPPEAHTPVESTNVLDQAPPAPAAPQVATTPTDASASPTKPMTGAKPGTKRGTPVRDASPGVTTRTVPTPVAVQPTASTKKGPEDPPPATSPNEDGKTTYKGTKGKILTEYPTN